MFHVYEKRIPPFPSKSAYFECVQVLVIKTQIDFRKLYEL